MKKDTHLKSLLGLSQNEAAMLLEITRMQWAQFTTGRRDIPLTAKEKLADVLTTLQKNKSINEYTKRIIETEKKNAHDWLLKEFKTIEYKELYLDRKIKTVEQIRKEALTALNVVTYLEVKHDNSHLQSLAKSIKSRATKTLNKNSLQHLQELQLKKESLEMLKSKIEQKLIFKSV